MKNLAFYLLFAVLFAWNALQGQVIFSDNFEGVAPCDNTIPSDWYVVGSPTLSDSCTGYDLPHGFANPLSGNHYASIVTYDRTKSNHRQYIGHTLGDGELILPHEIIYVEANIQRGEDCKWFHNGLAISFSHGGWSSTDSACSEGITPQLELANIFWGGDGWTAFGTIFEAKDTLDRFQIGTFMCDDELILYQEPSLHHPTTIFNIDDVVITRLATSVDNPNHAPTKVAYCTDLYGREMPCDSQGILIEVYENGQARKCYRLD
jgi:hypothetical protein